MDDSDGTFIYFAYGSNMLSRRLKARNRAPSATPIGTGYVSSRRLTFDKVSTDGSGKCDVESTANDSDRVYGVLFEIDKSEESKLDNAEGLGNGYKIETVEVRTQGGITLKAKAYVATKKEPALCPYHWYKAIVIAGAVEHKLPLSYIEWLRTINSKQDPNVKRCAENEALLFVD